MNVGMYQFQVRKLPNPIIQLGSINNGDIVSRGTATSQRSVITKFDDEVTLTNVGFTVLSGGVIVDGLLKRGKILAGGMLDDDAQNCLKQASGKNVTVIVKYKDPANETRTSGLIFKVR